MCIHCDTSISSAIHIEGRSPALAACSKKNDEEPLPEVVIRWRNASCSWCYC